jgi:serine/threonine-protein kinase haspin
MLAARTKRVAAYGRRGHRVVAVTDNHYLAATKAEQEIKNVDEEIWEKPRPSSTHTKKPTPRSTNPRPENGPGLPKSRKDHHGTPERRALRTISNSAMNSPAPFQNAKQGAASKQKYRLSGLGQPRPVVDVEITVVDDDGKILCKERRISSPRVVKANFDSDDDIERPVKTARTRQRRRPVYRIDSSEDSEDEDEEYIPELLSPKVVPSPLKRRNVTATYAKAKSTRRQTAVVPSVPTSPVLVKAAKARRSTRAIRPTRPIVLSDSESISSSEKCTPEDASTSPTIEPRCHSRVEVVLPRLSQVKAMDSDESIASTPQQHSLFAPSSNHGTLGNSPAPFTRVSAMSRPRTMQSGPSILNGLQDARKTLDGFADPTRTSDSDSDDLDISVDEELAEALRNAELSLRKEQRQRQSTVPARANKKPPSKPRKPVQVLSDCPTTNIVPVPKRPVVSGPLGSLLMECNQESPLDFDAFITSFPLDALHNNTDKQLLFCKIGEASYSEVFGIGEVVLKIIPLQSPRPRAEAIAADAPFTSEINDVLKEIAVTKAMGAMCRGFTNLIRCAISTLPSMPRLYVCLQSTCRSRALSSFATLIMGHLPPLQGFRGY